MTPNIDYSSLFFNVNNFVILSLPFFSEFTQTNIFPNHLKALRLSQICNYDIECSNHHPSQLP